MTEKMTEALAIIPRSFVEIMSMAEVLAKSSLLPKALQGKIPDVAMAIQTGLELGLAPTTALRTIHVVEGKPVLSADLMVGLVRARGACEYFVLVEEVVTKDGGHVTYETKRAGEAPQRFTWSHEDTKIAGLNTKDNWRLYPRQMRRARCKAILARDVFPDILAGIYEEDEFGRSSQSPSPSPTIRNVEPDAIDAEIVTESLADVDALRAQIAAATTLDGLLEIAKAANKLKGAERKAVHEAYVLRKRELETPAAAPVAETAA